MPILIESPQDGLNCPAVLVVEDSDADFYAFWRILAQLETSEQVSFPYPFLRFTDGDEALDYLFGTGDYTNPDRATPVLMFLDLNLPGTDGQEVIRQVKESPCFQNLPIIVLTTSNNIEDREACYRYGANDYLLKALGLAQMRDTLKAVFRSWFQLANLPTAQPF